METLQQIFSEEERKANVYALIEKFKERKKQSKEDSIKNTSSPEFQAALKQLKERNAERGTPIITIGV